VHVHLLTTSVVHAEIAKGGTNYWRGLALLGRRIGPTTCYELAPLRPLPHSPWAPDGLEILELADMDALVDALRERIEAPALVLKVAGAFRLDDWRGDLEVARLARRSGVTAVYVDADAPMRLPHLRGERYYLADVLPSFSAILLLAGGPRSVHEYRALAGVPTYHASAALTALPLLDLDLDDDDHEREYDLLVPVSAYSRRERHLVDVVARWRREHPSLRVALCGSWPEDAALDGVARFPFTDPTDLVTLYRSSRFTLNLLRDDFDGYSHTAAARIFEAALAASCVATAWFPGLPAYLEPELECLVVAELEELPRILRLPEPSRREIALRGRERVVRDCEDVVESLLHLLPR
jgi:Glycosyl transferases group 1